MTLIFHPVDPSDEAFRARWNARVAENELSLDCEFLRLLADTEPGTSYHFVQAMDPAGQVRALACYSVSEMRVMRFVPMRVLVLGGTVAAGKAFWFDADALDFASFLAGFEAFVKAQVRCDILVLKEFSPGRDDASMRSMTEAGFIAQMCYDRSRLALPPDGQMQSFLDSLPSKKRRYLRQVMAQGETAALEVAVHTRFDHLVEATYALYLAVNARASEARTPALPRSFFAALGQLDATRMLTVSQGTRMVGFGLLMQRGAKLKCMVIGLDYEVSRELQLWYQIVVRAIEHAMNSGCTSVDLGSTNHSMKRKFGAEHEDIWIAVRHRSRWVTRLLAPLIRHTLAAIYRPSGRGLPTVDDAN
ncbi:Acetyltransferase (GNAT) domain-containing protein [Variovorax sp. YR266]|uniref:GNAT family N-acetyltransferase n=1 Tax=Variovorax sp. YR266 TaxID=1884386 RepID=UPI000896401C|nr:GNAT family N-acetyltransferase [Variovorax sp. YR266]SDZ70498.1 Acetyltransferase (GNAT) domain-containing protein [Variovorax sp. YR266]